MIITTIRVNLDGPALGWVDHCRGETPRSVWVADLIDRDMTAAINSPRPRSVDRLLEDGVTRAAKAFRDGRPGYGTFILSRVSLAAGALEELQSHDETTGDNPS